MRLSRVAPGAAVTLRLGERETRLRLPEGGWRAAAPADAGARMTRAALSRACAPLARLVRPGMRVCVVVTDVTRPCPERLLLPALFARLRRAREVTVLVALGLHRPMTPAEKRAKYGRVEVVDHDPRDVIQLGEVDGVPIRIARRVAEADLVVATGVVEPHQYAGFSGGYKTVAIGCAGEETIAATHGLRFLEDPRVAPGRIEGNPFQRIVRAIGRRTRLRYVVNHAGGRLLAGAPDDVLRRGAAYLRARLQLPRAPLFDCAVLGVPAPRDANLYQASRALTYLACGARPVVREGGALVLFARAPEGAGRGAGERRFLDLFARHGSPAAVEAALRRDGVRGGEQRAFLLARTRQRHPVYVAGCEHPADARALGLVPVDDPAPLLRGRVLAIPDGMLFFA
jgi:nickel-dependent lactate racemase